ncbi:unnamed protein product [Boreogadus saida]
MQLWSLRPDPDHLCPKVSASTPSSTPPCCHHWSKKSITDIRLRDVKAAEDPPGSPWRTAMGLLEVFGSTSVQNAFQRMKPTHPWLS